MIRVELLVGLITLCLFVYCLIDVIQTPEDSVRNLPKMGWLLLVFFLPLVGSVAWLAAGRPEKRSRPARPGPTSRYPEYDRPGRATASNPDDDEEFLRRVRERAEEQRRRAEEERRRENGEPPSDNG